MKKILLRPFIFMLLFVVTINSNVISQVKESHNKTMSRADRLPLRSPKGGVPNLPTLLDVELQRNLEDELYSNPEWSRLIDEKKMAVAIVDLSDQDNVKFARINGLHMMYAASLPKIAVLLAVMDAIDKGEVEETQEVKHDMRIMISRSNNDAATRMIDLVGFAKIEAVMTDPKYEFYDKDLNGGLWVGKRYGKGADTNREPLKHLSHAASVTQVARFYYMLAYGQLVNLERSKQMLDILENPELHHKFVNSVEKVAPNARMFRKSGSWRTFHSDSIMVWDKNTNRRYIAIALIDNENGEQIIRDLVLPIEKSLGIK